MTPALSLGAMTPPVIRSALLCSHPSTSVVLGADVPAQGRLIAVTVAGDGVVLYDSSTQSLEGSFALGGAGRLSLAAPATLDVVQQACMALITDSSASHRLVSWPAATNTRKQRGIKPGGTFSTIADVLQSVPLPSPGSSVHILYPPQHANHPTQPSLTAVVLQDGSVGCCGRDAVQLQIIPTSTTLAPQPPPKFRASSATSTSLFTLHQASAGAQAQIHEYCVAMQGTSLKHLRWHAVSAPCPASVALTLHASPTYTLITWSTGAVTVVHGMKRGTVGVASSLLHLTLPPHIAPPSPPTNDGAPATPSAGSKRKAAATQSDQGQERLRQVAAAPVDGTQVLVLRAHSEGGESSIRFALLDQQYGCTVSTGTVNLEAVPQVAASLADMSRSPGTGASTLKLYSHAGFPGQVVLQVGSTLACMTVEARPANLLALVGKLAVSCATPTTQAAGAATLPAANAAASAALDVRALTQVLAGAGAATAGAAAGAVSAAEGSARGRDLTLETIPQADGLAYAALPDSAGRLVAALQLAAQSDKPAPADVLAEAADSVLRHSSLQPAQQEQLAGSSWAMHTRLVPLTAAALAQAGQWERLGAVLQVLPQQSLAGCGHLLPAAAGVAQFQLLPLLCIKLDDVQPAQLAQTLATLLTTDSAAAEQRKAYYAELRSTAEAAISHAERELQGPQPDTDSGAHARRQALALAQCAAAAVDRFSLSQVLLHAPLSMTMDPASLPAALRALSNRHVDRLLAYLAAWADKYTHGMGLSAAMGLALQPLPATLLFPTYTQVLEWVRLLIDAHLPRLLMSRSPPPSLTLLMELTRKQVKACQQLMPLAGVVEHVRSAAPLPVAHAAASQYTVQYIDLSIRA